MAWSRANAISANRSGAAERRMQELAAQPSLFHPCLNFSNRRDLFAPISHVPNSSPWLSGQSNGCAGNLVTKRAQLGSVLVQVMNRVEQALTQEFVANLVDCTHDLERSGFIVAGYRVQQFADVPGRTLHVLGPFKNCGNPRTSIFLRNFSQLRSDERQCRGSRMARTDAVRSGQPSQRNSLHDQSLGSRCLGFTGFRRLGIVTPLDAPSPARMVKLVDTAHLKCAGPTVLRVRVPLRAPCHASLA